MSLTRGIGFVSLWTTSLNRPAYKFPRSIDRNIFLITENARS
jgi:hypothetical protein